MLSSSIRCNTHSGNLAADEKQFHDIQSIYSNMYSMMLIAKGEATTPVAEGTSPKERSSPLGVEHRSVADENNKPPDTGCSPTEDVHTQRLADCFAPLECIPSDGTEPGVGNEVRNKVMTSILKSQHPSGMPVTKFKEDGFLYLRVGNSRERA